jgi:protein-tyrosine phosphatase
MSTWVPNLRDVGGMATEDGGVVRHGRVLRSAMPAGGDRAPDHVSWPPAVVLDLRSPRELEPEHPLVAHGSRVVNLPLLSALRPGAAPPDTLHRLYLNVVDDASSLLVDVVREVASADGPTLVHCAAGKDRTGVAIALLLRLVDAPRAHVVADYRATADAAPEIERRLESIPGRQHRATLPASFFDVSTAAIDGVMDVWDSHPEGVHGWLLQAGANEPLLDRLRRTLLT